ncbi:4425_t:CDS:2, partial [Paraglomus occultum]
MSTPQARPKTPPTEYGPSVTPPTFEEINLYHLSIVIESSESDAATTDNAIATIETGEANEYSNCKDSGHVSQYVLITAYLALIVNAILMSAVIIVLIQLIMYANHYEKRRGYLILWCIIEVLWRLWPIGYTAKQASTSYAIIHLLGIFLGKEHYLTLVNSFWPDSDPFGAAVDLSDATIIAVWIKLLRSSDGTSFTDPGLSISKIRVSEDAIDIDDLCRTLVTDVAFRGVLKGIGSAELKVYSRLDESGLPVDELPAYQKLSRIPIDETYGSPFVVVVAPPLPGKLQKCSACVTLGVISSHIISLFLFIISFTVSFVSPPTHCFFKADKAELSKHDSELLHELYETVKDSQPKIEHKIEQMSMTLQEMCKDLSSGVSLSTIDKKHWQQLENHLGIAKKAIEFDVDISGLKDIDAFKWDDRVEKEQSDRYLPWLRQNISLPREVEWYDVAKKNHLLDVIESPYLPFQVKGTADVAIIDRPYIRNALYSAGLRFLFELKKQVEDSHSLQAMAQLVVADIHSNYQ